MSIFQISAALFALFMLYIVNIHKKKSALSSIEVAAWCFIWITFIIIALFPNLLLNVAHTLKFARIFDFMTVVAFMVLTILIVLTYLSQKENSQKIEKYIRDRALSHDN